MDLPGDRTVSGGDRNCLPGDRPDLDGDRRCKEDVSWRKGVLGGNNRRFLHVNTPGVLRYIPIYLNDPAFHSK